MHTGERVGEVWRNGSSERRKNASGPHAESTVEHGVLDDSGKGRPRRLVPERVSGTVPEGVQVGDALRLLSVRQHPPKYRIDRRYYRPFQFLDIRDNFEG